MAPVVKALQARPDRFDLCVIVTGQHREMLDQVLKAFDISPDYDLKVMQAGQSLSGITSRVLNGLDPIFEARKPDMVVAQGDTTTTFAAALAAFYHHSDFGHVEAGLRTGNRYDPFPEEMNRLLTTRLATLHFAPTQDAVDNLLAENVPEAQVFTTGNTVIDALLTVSKVQYTANEPVLDEILARDGRMILVTAHRRENWGEPMERICRAIEILVDRFPDIYVAFAMHRNPIVRETVTKVLGTVDRVYLIEPPDYVPFVKLEEKCTLVLTDSGGVQEEAPSLGKPVLVMRETTERPEGVDVGTAKLVGTDIDRIVRETAVLLTDTEAYRRMAHAVSPYGDGRAAERIVDAISEYYLRELT
jgi:UDP-N-acetylglucosamine 2-epimerase